MTYNIIISKESEQQIEASEVSAQNYIIIGYINNEIRGFVMRVPSTKRWIFYKNACTGSFCQSFDSLEILIKHYSQYNFKAYRN